MEKTYMLVISEGSKVNYQLAKLTIKIKKVVEKGKLSKEEKKHTADYLKLFETEVNDSIKHLRKTLTSNN